jgi:HpcH/HpaI aldolase/citrate lyase family
MASVGMRSLTVGGQPEGYAFDAHHYPLMRILVAAKANGLQAIDGPYARIQDADGLRAAATSVAALGFDGKWVLHPAQVAVVNDVFTPAVDDYWRALRILDAYERATSTQRRGAVMLGEEMIDEASRKMALALVAKGEAAALPRPDENLDDPPGPERLEQARRQRQGRQFGRPGPHRVVGVVPRDEFAACHGGQVVADVEHAPPARRAAHRADQPAGGDDQARFLTDLPDQRVRVRFARLHTPAGYRPPPLAWLVAAPDKQQPPRAVLDHGAHAGYDVCGHEAKGRYQVAWW